MENRMKEKLRRRQGLSSMEVLCIVGIALACVAAIFFAAQAYAKKSAQGNDRLAMGGAERVAVTYFDENRDGTLKKGYFDPITHTIVEDCPKGYNNSAVVRSADGTLYCGAPHTLVICVETDGESLRLFWTEAKK